MTKSLPVLVQWLATGTNCLATASAAIRQCWTFHHWPKPSRMACRSHAAERSGGCWSTHATRWKWCRRPGTSTPPTTITVTSVESRSITTNSLSWTFRTRSFCANWPLTSTWSSSIWAGRFRLICTTPRHWGQVNCPCSTCWRLTACSTVRWAIVRVWASSEPSCCFIWTRRTPITCCAIWCWNSDWDVSICPIWQRCRCNCIRWPGFCATSIAICTSTWSRTRSRPLCTLPLGSSRCSLLSFHLDSSSASLVYRNASNSYNHGEPL